MSRDWSSRFLKSHHVVTWTVLHTPAHTSSGGHRWPPQAIRSAPPSLNAPVRLRRGRFLRPSSSPRGACALEASQTRPRVPRGASARTCRARARARPCRAKPRSRASPPAGPGRAPSARLTSAAAAAAGRARLLVLARRRHSLEERRRGGGCRGGFEVGGGGPAREKAAVRAPSDPGGGGGPSASRPRSKPPSGPGSGGRPGRPSLPSGVAFAPVAMAPQGTGTSGSSSSAAASPSRTFRGGGDPTTLPRSAGSQSSHAAGGGGARRTKREERGCGGGGLGAAGPGPGLGRPEVRSESAASDWWSASPLRYVSGLAGPLGRATKWRRGRGSGEASQRALHL